MLWLTLVSVARYLKIAHFALLYYILISPSHVGNPSSPEPSNQLRNELLLLLNAPKLIISHLEAFIVVTVRVSSFYSELPVEWNGCFFKAGFNYLISLWLKLITDFPISSFRFWEARFYRSVSRYFRKYFNVPSQIYPPLPRPAHQAPVLEIQHTRITFAKKHDSLQVGGLL